MEAFQSTKETIDDRSRVQEIRWRGKLMSGYGLSWRGGFRGGLTPAVEVGPSSRGERFRSVGQDEVELKHSSPMGVTPKCQCLTLEGVPGSDDGDL